MEILNRNYKFKFLYLWSLLSLTFSCSSLNNHKDEIFNDIEHKCLQSDSLVLTEKGKDIDVIFSFEFWIRKKTVLTGTIICVKGETDTLKLDYKYSNDTLFARNSDYTYRPFLVFSALKNGWGTDDAGFFSTYFVTLDSIYNVPEDTLYRFNFKHYEWAPVPSHATLIKGVLFSKRRGFIKVTYDDSLWGEVECK